MVLKTTYNNYYKQLDKKIVCVQYLKILGLPGNKSQNFEYSILNLSIKPVKQAVF